MAVAGRLHFACDTSGAALWKLVYAAPAPALAGLVLRYCGYVENTVTPLRRREVPFGGIPMIVNLGQPISVTRAGTAPSWIRPGTGFLAGLHDVYSLTETGGTQRGMQIDFSPIGAALFLHRPLGTLANEVIDLDTLLGPTGRELVAQLDEACNWPERFALLDRVLSQRFSAARPVAAELVHAWRSLEDSGGTLEIGALAEEIGWSRKHLIARFTDQFGLPPKRTARILRFDRAVKLLRAGAVESWPGLAIDCGFYDQAHMIRDFRRFAGSAPAEFLARQLPDGGGMSG